MATPPKSRPPLFTRWLWLGALFTFVGLVVALLKIVSVLGREVGEAVVSFSEGDQVEFTLEHPRELLFQETNFGLGSAPASFEKPFEDVTIIGPGGKAVPLQALEKGDNLTQLPLVHGKFRFEAPGTYQLTAVPPKHQEARSYGILCPDRPYTLERRFQRWGSNLALWVLLPVGLVSLVVGIVIFLVRLFQRLRG